MQLHNWAPGYITRYISADYLACEFYVQLMYIAIRYSCLSGYATLNNPVA